MAIIKVKDLLHSPKCHSSNNSDFVDLLRGLIRALPAADHHGNCTHHGLYFKDDTGCIPCQLESQDLKLNIVTSTEIEIRKWNLVFHSTVGPVLQIIGPLSTEHVHVAPSLNCPLLGVITVNQAQIIQFNREKCKAKSFSICGTVVYLSEIKRIKKDTVFLTTLCDEEKKHFIDILIKNTELLHWQQFLNPGDTVLLSHLQPTTLYKGELSKEAKLFVATSESQLSFQDDIHVKYLDLEDVLTDCQQLVNVPNNHSVTQHRCSPAFNYQGVITKIRDPQKHLYDLDDKIRLYVTFMSHQHNSILTVGTEVILYNVHHRKLDDVLHLYCCQKSCIKVSRFAYPARSFIDINKTSQFKCTIKPLNLSELEHQLAMEASLEEKFLPENIPRETGNFLYECLKMTTKEDCINRKRQSAVIEYLHHDMCPVQINASFNANKALVTFAELLEWSESLRDDSICQKNNDMFNCDRGNQRQNKSDENYWSYAVRRHDEEPCNGWLICGELRINEHTSLVELQDKTRSIPCVVAPDRYIIQKREHGHNPISPKFSHLVHQCQHHFLCPDVIGKLIYLRQYQIVTEWFVINTPCTGHNKGADQLNVKCYLLFSMEDVFVCLGGGSLHGHRLLSSHSANYVLRKRSFQDTEAAEDNFVIYKQLFRLISRDTLHIEHCTGSNGCLSFYAMVEFLGMLEREGVDQSMASSETLCNHNVESIQHDDIRDAESVPSCRKVLYFSGEMTKWFPFLHPGSLYWLKKKSILLTPEKESNVFVTHQLPENILRFVIKTEAIRCIRIDASVTITMKTMMVPTASFFTLASAEKKGDDSQDEVATVSMILNKRCTSNLVTIVGRIASRYFETSPWQHEKIATKYRMNLDKMKNSLGISVPGSKNLQLILQDLHNHLESITIYWHGNKLSYPLGLLPGSVVMFYKVELKQSKTDRMYINYIMASSHWIIMAPQVQELSNEEKPEFTECKLTLFCEMWYCDVASNIQASCLVICRIQQVSQLSIHATCVKCGSEWCRDKCSSERCSGTSHPYVQAEARCIVDDGTGTAMSFLNNKATVANLLTLSEKQWQTVEQEVIQRGSLTVTPNSGYTDSLTFFLSELVNSDRVKRSVTMIVKRFRMFRTPNGIKHPSVNTFTASDFPLKRVDFGPSYKTLETRSLPWLQLECLQLRENNSLDLYKYHSST